MTFRILTLPALFLLSISASAQISFIKKTNLLAPAKHYSGVAIGVTDMNGDGRDDIVRMNQGFILAIEFQTAPGEPFQHQQVANVTTGAQWGICVGDLDNNGLPDILTGGHFDGIKVLMANADGSAYTLTTLTDPETFAQTMNLADIDNNGWVDAFVCHDEGASRIFINNGSGQLVYNAQAINLNTVPATDNSGNYGSVWCDVDNDNDPDLYIAKCRTGINSPSDGRRINQLFLNNGDGTYTQDTANASGLRIGAQSWTADFGDIDNDGDFDCFVTNHDASSQLLENDGAGHFTDITEDAGLLDEIDELPVQAIFRDFDNDGFVDILVAGTGHYLFRNNSDKTFTAVPILDNNPMESFGLGDLNGDGFQDIYAGYAELFSEPSNVPDALWLNAGNDNHFFGLNLRGIESNRSAIGAKVYLYSALGTQVREVRAGESYGIMNSTQVHFGMGQHTDIDSVVIHWPSGAVEHLFAPAIDQYLTVEEGRCVLPPVQLFASGSTVFCSGENRTLAVTDAFAAYTWSTGETSPAIVADQAGLYTVTVTTNAGCTAVSNALSIVVDPVETPVISAASDTTFCTGGSVVLSTSPATAYLWSTGATTSSIEVTEPGIYTVTIQGLCAQFTSAPITVNVLDAPLPVPVPDTVAKGSRATLTASGDELLWFDAPAGGNLLFTGNPFKTDPLQESTTYWVANNAIYDQPNSFAGMVNHAGTQFASAQTNGQIIFDCYTPFRLARAKVYSGKSGVRKIELRDATGTVLQSTSINIPLGTSVIDLDLNIPVGSDLILTTEAATNQQSLGTVSPQLRRSDAAVQYPYEVPGYLNIKSSDLGTQRYYYFYNWEIDFYAYECLSERVPVSIFVDTTLVNTSNPFSAEPVRLYPNPSANTFQLEMENFAGNYLEMVLYDCSGIAVYANQQELPRGAVQMSLDLGALPEGVYLLAIRTESGLLRKKLVIVR